MNDDQQHEPKQPEHSETPDPFDPRRVIEGPDAHVDVDRAADEFYEGMLNSDDTDERELAEDRPGRGNREREAERRKSDYDVGYGKPPKEYRFRPGQSGNPNGRPRRKRGPDLPSSFNEALVRELARKQAVTIGGKTKMMSIEKIIAKRLVAAFANCEPKAVPALLNAFNRCGYPQAAEEMREREEERARLEHEAMVETWKSIDRAVDDTFGDDRGDDYDRAKEYPARQLAAEKNRGPRKPRF